MTMPHPDSQLVRSIMEMVQRAKIYRSCVACTKFDEPSETCTLYQQRPPARVIAMGCESFEEDPPF